MFDSVLGRGASAPSRFGIGAVASVLLHAGILAGVLILSSRAQDNAAPEKDIPPLVVFRESKPAGDGRPAAAPRPAQPKAVRPTPRAPLLVPSKIPPPPPKDPPPPPDGTGVHGPISSGPGKGSTDIGPGGGNGPGGGGGGGDEVSIFTEGMTRPVQLEGRDPQYTREALEARVEGKLIAKCVINTGGRLESCRIIKSLPMMDQAVLGALATKRYTPVMYQGRPVAVQYIFEFRLVLPR